MEEKSDFDGDFGPLLGKNIETTGIDGLEIKKFVDSSVSWIYCRHKQGKFLPQGWKLHVSATPWNASEILDRVVPCLLEEKTAFKIVADQGILESLNHGNYGFPQIGKFMTVYPSSDAQAVRLARKLHAATKGLRAPHVRTDRKICSDSIISYRYGDFSGRDMLLPTGEVVSSIVDISGVEVPDIRGCRYISHAWLSDPFQSDTETLDPPGGGNLILGRYLVITDLAHFPRGNTLAVVDLGTMQRRILKGAYAAACLDRHGRDAVDLIVREASVLQMFAGDVAFPKAFGIEKSHGQSWLVLEDISGQNLEEAVAKKTSVGVLMPKRDVNTIFGKIVEAVSRMHDRNCAHGDIKPSNIMLTDDGEIKIIDLGSSSFTEEPSEIGRGTHGYTGEHTNPFHRDIYGLGAVLYFLSTGINASAVSSARELFEFPLHEANSVFDLELAEIARGIMRDAGFTLFKARNIIESMQVVCLPKPHPRKKRAGADDDKVIAQLSETVHEQIKETLSRMRASAENGRKGAGTHSANLNDGLAGALLVLCGIVRQKDDDYIRATMMEVADELFLLCGDSKKTLPGLYVGISGAGAALLAAGVVLAEEKFIAHALEIGSHVAKQPYSSPDMFNGVAGRLRFHLLLWSGTGNPSHLKAAVRAGDFLLESALSDPAGTYWIIPQGYGEMSTKAYIGYAHGAAGIADALLDLYDAVADQRILACVEAASSWIRSHAVEGSPGEQIGWPTVPGGLPGAPVWCHGSSGIGVFFLHLAATTGSSEAREMAVKCADAVSAFSWTGPSICHGLAGNIDFLLDAYVQMGEEKHMQGALRLKIFLEEMLKGIACQGHGALIDKRVPVWNYMTGSGGGLLTLLRLRAPARIEKMLSMPGLGRTPGH